MGAVGSIKKISGIYLFWCEASSNTLEFGFSEPNNFTKFELRLHYQNL